MKKNLIALFMSVVLAVSNSGNITVFAAENQVSDEAEQTPADDNSDEENTANGREQTAADSTAELHEDQRIENEKAGDNTTTGDLNEELSDTGESSEDDENAISADSEIDDSSAEANVAGEMTVDENSDKASAAVSFAGGSGTVNDPYQVSTAAQLDAVRNNTEAYYIQTADIDMSSVNNWVPIGKDDDQCFWGYYDGNGHTISNLKLRNNGSERYIGLFGYSGPEIKNLNLKNVDVVINLSLCSDSVEIGTIAGNAPIINCSAKGTIIVTGSAGYSCDIGGLAGRAQGIKDSHSEVEIGVDCTGSQEMNVGGIAGECLHGVAKNSYYRGAISVSGNQVCVGGIAGRIAWSSGVHDCVNYGDISTENVNAASTIAGIVGVIEICDDREIAENCVNFGHVFGTGETFAVGITRADNAIYVHNCYDLGNIEGNSYSGRIFTTEIGKDNGSGNYAFEISTVNGSMPDGGLLPSEYNGMNMSADDIRINISDILDVCGCEWVEPQGSGEGFDLKEHGHCVINKDICFSYDDWTFTNWFGIQGYKIPLERYQEVYGDRFTKQIYKQEIKPWNGNCFGMTATAALFYLDKLPVVNYTHDVGVLAAGGYDTLESDYGFAYVKLKRDSELTKLIERYQIWNESVEWTDMYHDFQNTEFENSITDAEYFQRVLNLIEETDEPLMLIINWIDDNGKTQGHALLVDTFRPPVKKANGWVRLYLYDPNNPYFEHFNGRTPLFNYKQAENRYIDVNTQNGQWCMSAMVNGDGSETSIGYENGVKQSGSEVGFASVSDFPLSFDRKASFLVEGDKTSIRYTCDNLEIFNDNNDLIFSVSDGRVVYKDETVIYDYHDIGITTDSNTSITSGRLLLPSGTYTSSFNNGCVSYSSDGDYEGVATKDAVEVKNIESTKIEITSDTNCTANLVIEDNYDGFTSVETDIELGDDASVIELNEDQLIINSNEEQNVSINVITEDGERDISDVSIDSQTTITLIENEIPTGCAGSEAWDGDEYGFNQRKLYWELEKNGTLRIRYEGLSTDETYSLQNADNYSWREYKNSVLEIRVGKNISNLQKTSLDGYPKLRRIVFENDPPAFMTNNSTVSPLIGKTLEIYYPADNTAWTSNILKDYGGNIEWKPYYRDISNCTAYLLDTGVFYTGKEQKPRITINNGGLKMNNEVDYKVSYSNNTKAGTAIITITGIGAYTGKIEKIFSIMPRDITPLVTLLADSYVYTGSSIKPSLDISYNGKPLQEGVDYQMYFENASGPGTATVYVYGIWNFSGEVAKSYTIKRELTGSWKKNSAGWWYDYGDGSYPRSKFENIGDKTYYFNGSGYMVTGWQKVDGTWYYFNGSGAMQIGWQSIGGKWYCFDENGKMIENDWVGNYYLGSGGAMVTGWQKIDGAWYYFNSSGAKQTGWQKIGNTWYYFDENGKMIASEWVGNYYFSAGGAMVTGWQKIDGAWYYFNSSGAKQTDWQKIGNTWYFFDESGVMQTGLTEVRGRKFYFSAGGAMQTGWQKIDGVWYYFEGNGVMAVNKWVGNYYLGEDGVMATNTWIGKYYVGADGKWIPNYKAAN